MSPTRHVLVLLCCGLGFLVGCTGATSGLGRYQVVNDPALNQQAVEFLRSLADFKPRPTDQQLLLRDPNEGGYLVAVAQERETSGGVFLAETRDLKSLTGVTFYGRDLLVGIQQRPDEYRRKFGPELFAFVQGFVARVKP